MDKIARDESDDKQATELKETLVNSKQYLNGDYNVKTIIFTQKLGAGQYKANCAHDHNQICDRCSKLHKVRLLGTGCEESYIGMESSPT